MSDMIEKTLGPIELDDAELDAVAGGQTNSFNNIGNNSNNGSGNDSFNNTGWVSANNITNGNNSFQSVGGANGSGNIGNLFVG